MENLTNRQRSILMNLYVKSVKTEPLADLTRILKYYNDNLKDEVDDLIITQFKSVIENVLYLTLSSNFKFYQLDYYIEKYEEELQDYIEDVPDSLESDFIERCIAEQYSILDCSVKFYVELDYYNKIDVMEFVSDAFLDEYKNSSKRKIEFLQSKLPEYNFFASKKVNPKPLLFVSRKVYDDFLIYTSRHIIDFYIDYSYLKKRLELEELIFRTTDNKFMKLIFEEFNLISASRYQEYLSHNKLRSISKSYSVQRENNFNLVFKS
jgi:hypothetical protein